MNAFLTSLGRYLWKWPVQLDLAVATLLPGGKFGVTFSSRAATAQRDGKRWGCVLCAWLDKINPGHCQTSLAGDIARAEAALRDLRGEDDPLLAFDFDTGTFVKLDRS